MADNGSDDGRKRAADQNDDTVPSPKRTKGAISDELQAKVDEWMLWDTDPETRAEMEALVAAGDSEILSGRLLKRIRFGTAGLRARMQAGFGFMNRLIVTQTSQGLLRYLESTVGADSLRERGVVVGHDARYRSLDFALITAATFLSQGVKVSLFSTIVPTPYVAFQTTRGNFAAGVMVTASHNPKDDNGYKVYWGNGCQIIPPHDSGIAGAILENLAPWEGVDVSEAAVRGHELCSDPLAEVEDAYFAASKEWLSSLADGETVEDPKITYTAMHGVGTPAIRKVFEAFGLPPVIEVAEQCAPDPDFPTVAFPNPEEGKGALALAMATADANGSTIILANDPDADRLAVAEKQADGEWYIFNGNELGIIFADWCWTVFQTKSSFRAAERSLVINTAVSSKMLSKFAEVNGLRYEETLTGFKWMGNKAIQLIGDEDLDFVFAYEEAIGFMMGDICFDKDGVRAAAVAAELVVALRAAGETLHSRLQALYERYGHWTIQTRYFFCYDRAVMDSIFDAVRADGNYPTTCGEYPISNVRDQKTGYDSRQADQVSQLPHGEQMITFYFENGAIATIRASGTEPKLKYYVEVVGTDAAEARSKMDAMTAAVVENFLKPEQNNLVTKKE